MGIYLALFGFVMLWAHRGGQPTRWFWVTLTAPVLVVIAGDHTRAETPVDVDRVARLPAVFDRGMVSRYKISAEWNVRAQARSC
jgi:hypothetical protein